MRSSRRRRTGPEIQLDVAECGHTSSHSVAFADLEGAGCRGRIDDGAGFGARCPDHSQVDDQSRSGHQGHKAGGDEDHRGTGLALYPDLQRREHRYSTLS